VYSFFKAKNHTGIASKGEGIAFLSGILTNTQDPEEELYILQIISNLSANEDICLFLMQAELMQAVITYLRSENESFSTLAREIMNNLGME
jgi:hypothetical protein